MRTRIPTTLILSLIITTTARATTYTWSATDGNFSTPTSWTGPAPSPTGSPDTQLLFPAPADPTATSYTVTLDTPTLFSLNTLTADPNFPPSDSFSINAGAPGAGLLFTGPAPTINTPTNSQFVINAPVSATTDLTIAGNIDLTAPLSFTTASNLTVTGDLLLENGAAPSNLNQLRITGQAIGNSVLPASFSCNLGNTTGNITLSFGAAPILLTNGSFSISAGILAQPSVTITNPINVVNDGTLQGAGGFVVGPTENFTGPIDLNGTLHLNLQFGGTMTLAGPITLDQFNPTGPAIYAPETAGAIHITGNIIDNPALPPTLPLSLAGPTTISSRFPGALGSISTPGLLIDGTNNTYSSGTTIYFGNVFVSTNSTLGTGPVSINYAATLHLSAPTNIAPSQKVFVQSDSTLAISFDSDPSSIIRPDSPGILALDTTFTTPLDMSKLGNGQMSLTSTANATYAAPTLLPAADHVYRFASNGLGSTLTLLHGVLTDINNIPSSAQLADVALASPNSFSGGSTITDNVYANAPGALGTGPITVGTPRVSDTLWGTLYISVPNLYTPNTPVNVYGALAAVGVNGTIPLSNTAPILHPGSMLILGDNLTTNSDRYPDTMPLRLDSSTLLLKGLGTTTETIGSLTVAGLSTVALWNTPAGYDPTVDPIQRLLNARNSSAINDNSTTLIAASLTHEPHAVLFYVPFYMTPTVINAQPIPFTPAGDTFRLLNAPLVTNGMVAPWIQSRNIFNNSPDPFFNQVAPSFLNYTADGFVPATYSPLPTNGGTGTEIVDIPFSTPTVLSTDTSIYALRTANSLANPSSGPVTLHILGGGLIATSSALIAANGSFFNFIEPNVDFGNAEAFINIDSSAFPGAPTISFTGILTATNGLTKFGPGSLILSNLNNNIHGPITIHEGTLQLASLPDPNSNIPITLSNTATLELDQISTLSRPLIVNAGSNLPGPPATLSSHNPLTIAAPITGNGALAINAPDITLAANISLGGISFNHLFYTSLNGAGVISAPSSINLESIHISPGRNPGDLATLTFDTPSLGIDNCTTFTLDLDPSGLSDRILVTGALDIYPYDPANTFGDLPRTLNLHFLAPPTGQIYTLLSASSLTGTFSEVTGLPPNYTLDYTPTSILLIPSSVPEPATLALSPISSVVLLRRRARTISTPG